MRIARADPISHDSLCRLYPRAIDNRAEIASLLEAIKAGHVALRRGTNPVGDDELAWISEVESAKLRLLTEHFRKVSPSTTVFLNCEVGGIPFFFTVLAIEAEGDQLSALWPAVVYQSERRDRLRRSPPAGSRFATFESAGERLEGQITDESPGGLGIVVDSQKRISVGAAVRVTRAARDGESVLEAEVKSCRPVLGRPAARRLGLAVLPSRRREWVQVDAFSSSVADSFAERDLASIGKQRLRASTEFRTFFNSKREHIRSIVSRVGEVSGAPAVLIPPAWGKTKETLLPLALTIQETFEASLEPISIVRFDGVRKRGASYNDPECRNPATENLHYTFSQGVDDIRALIAALEADASLAPSKFLIVSFSMASIEARRAIAMDQGGRIAGWVSVVGAVDPQSLIRVVSGGIDYIAGAERGIQFGRQDVQGLLLDVDRASRDALDNGLGFLEDARRDFAAIKVPVTWIHGVHDGWASLERARDALSCGDPRERRIIEAPTGHQLRDSRDASLVFARVAEEVAQMAVGRRLRARFPGDARLREQRRLELGRRRTSSSNVRQFWSSYLVGSGDDLGMELVAETSAYRGLAAASVRALGVGAGERIVDLGCGLGGFIKELSIAAGSDGCEIVGVDFVLPALRRARTVARGRRIRGAFAVADLDRLGVTRHLPFSEDCFDAAVASLVLNYLSQPAAFLTSVLRILRPGGRLVLSCLRRDADVSKICTQGVAELRSGLARAAFGDRERELSTSLPRFINSAAKLLDLEEQGTFAFWDRQEVAGMVERAGFSCTSVSPVFGDPPQAYLVVAKKPGTRAAPVA